MLWDLEPHTRGKHEVLRRYLDAWLPIMGMSFPRILFIDGFAGPGEYVGGEVGSPVIALKALLEHPARDKIKSEIRFVFIEKDLSRCDHLRTVTESFRGRLPSGCHIHVENASFDETLVPVLAQLEETAAHLSPAFVMVDPFGVSGTPMGVIRKILRNPRSEIYASFMYESINRFKSTPQFEAHLDSLFGCRQWRDGINLSDPQMRKDFYYGLYEDQLRKAGAENVVHFDLYEENRLVYAVFFATKHWKGSDRMKSAIWKIAPTGDFSFHGTKSRQLPLLGLSEPDFTPLQQALTDEFGGRDWFSIDEAVQFVASDKTDYYSAQLRKGALRPMEASGVLQVDPQSRKKVGTYPVGTRLRFG